MCVRAWACVRADVPRVEARVRRGRECAAIYKCALACKRGGAGSRAQLGGADAPARVLTNVPEGAPVPVCVRAMRRARRAHKHARARSADAVARARVTGAHLCVTYAHPCARAHARASKGARFWRRRAHPRVRACQAPAHPSRPRSAESAPAPPARARWPPPSSCPVSRAPASRRLQHGVWKARALPAGASSATARAGRGGASPT